MSITRDEWLRALQDSTVPVVDDQDAVTISEFAHMFELSLWSAASRLRHLHRTGKASRTSKRSHDTAGRYRIATAYKLITDTQKARKR